MRANKMRFVLGIILFCTISAKSQNSPFFIYGGGLDGSVLQKTAIYAEVASGLVIEAPKDASGAKLPIQFSWRGGGEPVALKILSNGNLGIGTDNPEFKLDVQGGSANINFNNISSLGGQLTISNGYGNQNGAVRLNLNNGGAVSWIKGIVTGPNTNTGSAIVFGVPSNTADGVERMRITSAGDVGIGTENPLAKLQVAGNIRQNFSSGDGDGFSQYSGLTHILSITRQVNNLSLSAFDGIGLAPGSANGPSNNYALYAMSGGNVGIGTNKPSEKLSVNGKIRAHEIKVETANWPDYVFAKGYQLPSMAETEKYIKEKGHLPGIPSAKVVKDNGIDLGEMNAKLLQKIEELTLHLIEQKSSITELQNQNKDLLIEIKKIKTKL